MINEKYSHLVTGYLHGTLSDAEQEQLQKLIEEGKLDFSDLRALEDVYTGLDPVEVPEPGPQMHERFYSMLEAEKARQVQARLDLSGRMAGWLRYFQERMRLSFTANPAKIPVRKLRGAGVAVALFLAGLLIGNLFTPISSRDDKIDRLTSEVYRMQELMMISLLENDSPTERLRAVTISHDIPAAGSRVAEALLQTLNNDPNVNVRIAAVDALTGHASDPAVRSGMVRSISAQESPLVQIALADAMITLQEKDAVNQFEKLLENDDMDTNVRNKLENTILALK